MKLQIAICEMEKSLRNLKPSEQTFATGCVGLGLTVAATLAPWNIYFIPNFFYYWFPHALVLGVLLLVGLRPAAIGGSALALAIFLGVYGTWVFYRRDTSGLAWLGYWPAILGAMVGAFGSKLFEKISLSVVMAACIAFGFTALGISTTLIFVRQLN